jgi:uncharacterized repeat protein (TIGR01451 family)
MKKKLILIILTLLLAMTFLNVVAAADSNDENIGTENGQNYVEGSQNSDIDPTDLAINKDVDMDTVNYGDYDYYYITVTNNGPDNATGVTVTDPVISGLHIVEWSVSWDGGLTRNDSDASFDPDTGVWTIGNMTNGDVYWLDISCIMNTTGIITNTATITGNQYDPNPENNQDNATVTIPGAADLAIDKFVDDETVNYGDYDYYYVTVTNNGPNNATGVTVTDPVITTLQIISWGVSWDGGQTRIDMDPSFNPTTGIWDIGTNHGTMNTETNTG